MAAEEAKEYLILNNQVSLPVTAKLSEILKLLNPNSDAIVKTIGGVTIIARILYHDGFDGGVDDIDYTLIITDW